MTGYMGDTVIFGNTVIAYGGPDIFLAKADSSGIPLWIWTGGGDETDHGRALALDDVGNIYLGGFFCDTAVFGLYQFIAPSSPMLDAFLCKFTPDGTMIWAKQWGAGGSDVFMAMDFGADKALYLVGETSDTVQWDTHPTVSAGMTDVILVKTDTAGDVLMAKSFGGDGPDRAHDVDVASTGEVFLAGFFGDTMNLGADVLVSAGGDDGFVVKLTSMGFPIWAESQAGDLGNVCTSLSVSESGDIFFGGYFSGDSVRIGDSTFSNFGPQLHIDAFVGKISSAGQSQWAKLLTGYQSGEHIGDVVAVGNEVYLAGGFGNDASWDGTPLSGSSDIIVARLNPNGDTVWFETIGGANHQQGRTVAFRDGYLYVAGLYISSCLIDGHTLGADWGDFFVTRRSDEAPNQIEEPSVTRINVYPNPADSWTLTSCSCDWIEIRSLSGQLVSWQPTISGSVLLDVSPWAPGLYTVHAIGDRDTGVTKVIVY